MKTDLVCFGELLWDVLPGGKVAGGAPYNIVNRATALGIKSEVISSVGHDPLGQELLDLVREKGNSVKYIQIHKTLPTSTVQIIVGESGEPDYDIVHPVAWDDIRYESKLSELIKSSRAFVYSSLGLRDERSREVLFRLLDDANLAICDINMRDGHFSRETILRMIERADILRMNENELSKVSAWMGISSASIENKIEALHRKYGFDSVIVTLGPEGAVSLRQGQWTKQAVFDVHVEDTVGSGDAFLAAYISKRLADAPENSALRFACAIGALNASKKGGTPHISTAEIDAMLSLA